MPNNSLAIISTFVDLMLLFFSLFTMKCSNRSSSFQQTEWIIAITILRRKKTCSVLHSHTIQCVCALQVSKVVWAQRVDRHRNCVCILSCFFFILLPFVCHPFLFLLVSASAAVTMVVVEKLCYPIHLAQWVIHMKTQKNLSQQHNRQKEKCWVLKRKKIQVSRVAWHWNNKTSAPNQTSKNPLIFFLVRYCFWLIWW